MIRARTLFFSPQFIQLVIFFEDKMLEMRLLQIAQMDLGEPYDLLEQLAPKFFIQRRQKLQKRPRLSRRHIDFDGTHHGITPLPSVNSERRLRKAGGKLGGYLQIARHPPYGRRQ